LVGESESSSVDSEYSGEESSGEEGSFEESEGEEEGEESESSEEGEERESSEDEEEKNSRESKFKICKRFVQRLQELQEEDATKEGYDREKVIERLRTASIERIGCDGRLQHQTRLLREFTAFGQHDGKFCVVSTDPENNAHYLAHILPIVLKATGVKVFATESMIDVSTGQFGSTKPWASGFRVVLGLCIQPGWYSSIGCLCKQKRLNFLWGVKHLKSNVLFFVGSECVQNFYNHVKSMKQDFAKASRIELAPGAPIPPFLQNLQRFNADGSVKTAATQISLIQRPKRRCPILKKSFA
jgi:hypothetical protein